MSTRSIASASLTRRTFLGRRPRSASARSPWRSLLDPATFAGTRPHVSRALAGRRRPAASRAARQARHPPVHGRRAVAVRDLRLQAEARRRCTASRCPSRSRKGQQHRPAPEPEAAVPRGRSSSFKQLRHSRARRSATSSRTSATIADDICIIRSMQTEQINHDPAHTFMNTGSHHQGPAEHGLVAALRPRQRERQPARLRRAHRRRHDRSQPQPISPRQWTAASCPSQFQGVAVPARKGDPVLLPRPTRPASSAGRQRQVIDAVARLNRLRDGPRSTTRRSRRASRQYEMAFRMQTSVPGADRTSPTSRSRCSTCTASKPADGSFASNCLLARRLAERGVRFIQLYHRGWDHHGDITAGMKRLRGERRPGQPPALVTRPEAARHARRHARHLGRRVRPHADGQGRANAAATTTSAASRSGWPAAASSGGITYGATDELGYHAVENPVHVHDLHATMLHLLGIDHKRLTYPLPGPRLPPDRRGRQGGARHPDVGRLLHPSSSFVSPAARSLASTRPPHPPAPPQQPRSANAASRRFARTGRASPSSTMRTVTSPLHRRCRSRRRSPGTPALREARQRMPGREEAPGGQRHVQLAVYSDADPGAEGIGRPPPESTPEVRGAGRRRRDGRWRAADAPVRTPPRRSVEAPGGSRHRSRRARGRPRPPRRRRAGADPCRQPCPHVAHRVVCLEQCQQRKKEEEESIESNAIAPNCLPDSEVSLNRCAACVRSGPGRERALATGSPASVESS